MKGFSVVCTPPPFSKDIKAQSCCLSSSKLLYLNVRIANFAVINSRTVICKFPSFSDHFPKLTPHCKSLFYLILMHVCIPKFGSFCFSDLPFFDFPFHCDLSLFFTHQRSSCFDQLFYISAWYEQAWFSDCICCCFKYLRCR